MRKIDHVYVRACRLPTLHVPESDGTLAWSATTIVIVRVAAGGELGLGYTYADAAAAGVVEHLLEGALLGSDPFATTMLNARMVRAVRNHGRAGLCACAISAVDVALWDLKAKLVGLPLADLLGRARDEVPTYASGGFCSTSLDDLATEVSGYAAAGHTRVKIKIGRDAAVDRERVAVVRAAAPDVALMVDANGAYARKQAVVMADWLAEHDAVYFEEPVSSDDLDGLRLVRDRARLAIAAGEYGYDPMYFRRLVDVVDILQADATRCGGVTGFLQAAALADAAGVPLSAHCAPAIHVHAAAAAPRLAHVEHFFDHWHVEQLLFEGAPLPRAGMLAHDTRRPGLGLELREREAERHAA
jgi:L-alanine-DL-glutamate epimerase-like enolase superfamily enzyme